MTRPIIWALATFGSVAIAATVAGQRLARLAPAQTEAAGASSASSPSRSGPSQANAGRTVTLGGDRMGHFHVEAAVDGRRLTMMVDTGASIVALTHEDARTAGIRTFPSDFTSRIGTANGQVLAARVRLRELRVGDIEVRDVEAVVLPAGRLGVSLLGMSFLRQLRSFDIAGDRLTLRG